MGKNYFLFAAIISLAACVFFILIRRPELIAITGAGFIFFVVMFIVTTVRQKRKKKLNDAHSQAFKDIKRISESGYERSYRGFYPQLLDGIYEWEREEIEDYIWNAYHNFGYTDMAPLLPKLKKYAVKWTIKQIFDGEYGCEERSGNEPMVSVTLADENGNERYVTVPDSYLTAKGLDVGSEWVEEELK